MPLTILVPVYNESRNIPLLHSKLRSVLDENKFSYEIIFVDDGSTDNTQEVLKNIMRKDRNVRNIEFQKNFGKSAALNAGFDHAKNDIIITMDGDLQDDPIEIPRFVAKLGKGYDLVSGWKFRRKDPIGKTLPSKFFNNLTAMITGLNIHDFNCGYKAYRKKVVDNIEVYGELHRYIPALAAMKGFKVGEIKVRHHRRKFGQSKYGVSRLFKGLFDLITISFFMKFAKRPLHFFGVIGLLSFAAGIISGLYLVYLKLLGESISNRPLMVLVILLLIIGTQFISLGLLAELIIKGNTQNDYVIK